MPSRRNLLISAAAGGAAVTLDPVSFAAAAPGGTRTSTLTGTIGYGAPDWVYVPLEIPRGVNAITVGYSYDRPAPPAGQNGNALDIGIFDESGHALGDARGFRGWSGGFRTEFTISAAEATPGYLPGPIRPGTWHVIFGAYTVHPQGLNWTLTVTLSFGPPPPPFRPKHAPHRAAGRGDTWYRGDPHLHTVHSDGRRTPAELAAGARAAKLDFFVSTEHNTTSAHGVWGEYAGPDLLIIDGEEVTTRNGHYTALGLPAGTWIDWRYRAADGGLQRFVDRIHQAGGLAVAAHPNATCVACGWRFGYAGLDAVEVWNGPWTPDDDAVLAAWDNLLVSRRGRQWLPAVGASDAHSEPQVIGLPHTVVRATGLDRRAILAALRSGHSWIAESAAVNLSFTAASPTRTAHIGDRLPAAPTTPVQVALTVTGAPGATARLISDQGVRVTTPLPADGTVSWPTVPQNSRYVRAEVRRADSSMVALTNPIFLGD
ncbi:CehA/McbA family metallohydrolase [Actinoplanes sp. NPDC049265]|uniref:CehA/McbA family metallohydrolase n=1 Tax=Actinoplanes sp. NPDC049265 TaxID=3363902 RepID=UPI00371FC0DA